MKSFSFIPFIIILVLFGVLFWIKLPETKNKTFDEIYRIFQGKPDSNGRQKEADGEEVRQIWKLILTCYDNNNNNNRSYKRIKVSKLLVILYVMFLLFLL